MINNIGNKDRFERINVEGTTNNGCYICFIHVKFSHMGRGILQAFVPGYVICKANGVKPLPKCEEIRKIRFFGECLDRFYYPKRIIETSDFYHSNDITLEVNHTNLIAINLYKKYGFKPVSVRKNYYGSSDAILMVRKR